VAAKAAQRGMAPEGAADAAAKPAAVRSLQRRFLSVFWMLRMSDWLQGPYFYQVYSTKVFNGVTASMATVSRLFLMGFGSTAIAGPFVGKATDRYGRKAGTIAFGLIYALGAISTKSPLLWVLFLGRIMSGIGTSLLFSAPESWLVAEAGKIEGGMDYLGETFGLAYAGDSIVAITAGQLASMAAAARGGATGAFELSVVFLALGSLLAAFTWKENVASGETQSDGTQKTFTISDAIKVVLADQKILLVGATQALFEAAMYIFVLQWPPAVAAAVARTFGAGTATPYGKIFSCFMTCCLLGSTLFGALSDGGVATERSTAGMLTVAAAAMGAGVAATRWPTAVPAAVLVGSFFAFEACVGMYFPSIGTLRSKYIPDANRSVIMNLFGIPLNVLVVSVFLSINKLGLSGALGVSATSLGLAALCMGKLMRIQKKEALAT